MHIIKKKLLKSTVAKVMAAAMVVTMVPVHTTVNAEENTTVTEETAENTTDTEYTEMPVDTDGTITLDKNVNLSQEWTLKKDITLDLNGHTITFSGKNSRINVKNFKLTIKDNDKNEGKILKQDSEVSNVSSLIKVGDGNQSGIVILNGGTIENTTPEGYGILAAYDSSVYINGGTIHSYYAALGGNNNWGQSNFYVASGTLKANIGPCIYKPSAGNLCIGTKAIKDCIPDDTNTNFNADDALLTLTGGVGVRMGTVFISEGKFNATNNTGESNETTNEPTVWSPAQYYANTHQNVYFPDALFVLGGGYNSSTSNNNTDLTLTIKGGTFTCDNDKGSAIAIYDFGKTSQTMTVEIQGGTFNKTSGKLIDYTNQTNDESAEKRTSFDVLTLNDILGNNKAQEDYGTVTNNVQPTITGGIFSELSGLYSAKVADGYCISIIGKVDNHTLQKKEYKSATQDENGNIECYYCTNCDKYYLDNTEDSLTNSNEVFLYYLSVNNLENIKTEFTDKNPTGSYGQHRSETLTIAPESGYTVTEPPTVTIPDDATVTCGTVTRNSDGSYTCTINAKTDSTLLKNCELTISAKTEKITYAITLVDSSLKNASAKLENDTITITPDKGYAFKVDPTITADNDGVTIEKLTAKDGIYTSKVSAPTKDCTITVSGEATPVTYKVSLDKSSLKDANAYIIKGDTKITTETVDATVNDKLQVVIEPNAGKVFTEPPTVNGFATTLESGAYKYNVPALTGDTTLKVSGTAEDVKYSIKFINEPTIEHATVKLEPAQVALNGKASLIIEPEAGYRITSTKAEVKDNGKICTLSETAELSANGVFIYTISDIKGDVEITSVTATVETAELVELGTDTGNANSANLSDTFAVKGSQEEQKEQKENHTNILEAIKDVISKITKDSDSVIFDEKSTSTLTDADKEKLITEIKEAMEGDASKVALSLEVKEDSTVKEDVKNNAKTEITKKTANSNATVGKLYTLDISLFAHIIGKDGVKIKLKDTQKGQIAIKMNKPADIPEKPASATRRYYIVCFHENESPYIIDVTENKDGTLSFKGSKFSTYILSYVDTTPSSSISGGGSAVVLPSGSSGGSSGGSTGGSGATSTTVPTASPSTKPVASAAPSIAPSVTPSATSSVTPAATPTAEPSITPSAEPSAIPTAKPVKAVKVGQKVTAASINYKVTSVSGSRTVTVTGAKSVKSVVIPANIKINGKIYKVTAIANNAFKGNKKLIKITIGTNISKIGKNAFNGCTNLKKVIIKTIKLTANKIGKNAFKGINKKAVIKVPKSKVKAYKKIIRARGVNKSVKIK